VRKLQTLSLFLLALTVNFGKCKLYIGLQVKSNSILAEKEKLRD
jgi:hypothetical protein